MNISISLDDEAYNKLKEYENKSELICNLIKEHAKPKAKVLIGEINEKIEILRTLGYTVNIEFSKVV